MDIRKILAELRQELTEVSAAILSLEQLARGGRRRGRPPSWIAEARKKAAPSKRAAAPDSARRKRAKR